MPRRVRFALLPILVLAGCAAVRSAQAQVFVVGEKTATDGLDVSITPTNLPLPDEALSERGRRELVRGLEAEQGFAHRILPLGGSLTLYANGRLVQTAEEYKRLVYNKGQAVAPGERIAITNLEFQRDKLIVDLNGGPFLKHRFLRHVEVNGSRVVDPGNSDFPTGTRIELLFEGGIPELTAPEVKTLLSPLLDFGLKTSDEAYADTLPTPVRNAVAKHEILVGMNHKMVLAAMGQPESKLRERPAADQVMYEEWIYGHVPQTVRFVRFQGDKVILVKIAAVGQPLEVHSTDELNGYSEGALVHEIASGDIHDKERKAPPSLRLPGDPEPIPNGEGAVRMPPKPTKTAAAKPADAPAASPDKPTSGDTSSQAPTIAPVATAPTS